MADILNKKKDVYLREKTSFLKELQSFHQIKGTPYQRLPQIDGKEIDLYLLYYLVTANGGWEKVNAFDSWDHLIQYFSLPKDCTNGAQALKYIYLRYLDLYERVHFLGEDLDRQHREEEHEDEKRSMRRALRAFATQHVPTSYNHAQHMVSESQRNSLGFAALKERGKEDYERILLSLLTPMPNEQDFAVNLCHMMSSEKMQGLNLEANPRIVDALLAHAGVFSHEVTREAISSVYRHVHGVNISNFWRYSICDKDFLELASEKMPERILPPDIEKIQLDEDKESDVVTSPVQIDDIVKLANHKTESLPRAKEPSVDQFKDKIRFVEASKPNNLRGDEVKTIEKCEPRNGDSSLSDSDYELFALKNHGKRDIYGFRVLQILHIIRNLSFEEVNQTALAKNMACIRFLLLCSHSDRSELKALACEAFGNIAYEFHLEDPITSQISAMLLGTISKGLVSQDRAVVLGCLEILSKLCQNQENETILQSAVDQKLCESICNYLTAHDIYLLIMTLECLLSVSSLGESSCNRILNSNASLSTLLSLLTVEAQSFGQRACIGMQVIDANTGVAPVPLAATAQSTPIKPPPPKTPAGKSSTPKTAQTPVSSQPKVMDAEDALKVWLKTVVDPARGSFCDLADLHRLYVETYAKPKKLAVLTTQQLTKVVRGTFGTSVGPSRKPNTTSFDLQFSHLRLKPGVVVPSPPQPSTPVIRPQAVEPKPVEVIQATPVAPQPLNSPILKAQLSVPTASKPVVQRQQQHQRVGDPVVNTVVNNSTTPAAKPVVNGIMSPQFPKEVKIEIKDEPRAESRLETLLNHSEDKKSVLSDLLEKDVNGYPPRRDVRIGDKGLELVLNEEIAPNITARVDEEGAVQLHIEDKSTDSSEIALPLLQQNGGSSFQNLLIEKGIIEEKPNRNRNRKRKMNPSGEDDPKRRRSTPPPGGQPSILQKAMELAHIEDELLEEEPKENGVTANFTATTTQSRLSALLSSNPRPQPVTSAPIQHSQISSTSGPSQPRVANGPKDQELLLQQPDGTIVRVVQGLQSRQIMQQLVQSQSAAQNSQAVQQQVMVKEQSNVGQIVIRDPQTGKQQIVQGVLHPQKPEPQKVRKPEMKVVHPQSASGSHVVVGQGSNQVVVNQALMNQQQVVLGQGSNQQVVLAQGANQQVVLGQSTNQVVLNQSGSGQKQYIVQTSAGLQVMTGTSNQMYVQSNGQQIVLANSSGQAGGHQQLLLANSSGAGQQYIVSANSNNGQQLVLGSGQNGGQQIVLSNSQGQQMKFVLINSQNNQQIVLNKTQKAVSPVPSEEAPKVQKEAPHHPQHPPAQLAASQATHGSVQNAVSQSSKVPYSADAAFLCEWRTCMRAFRTPNELYVHSCRVHCPNGMEESQCQWERCDDLKRKRLSLMTHLYDRHCSEEIQKRLSLRRKQIALQGKTDIPLPNLPPPHPGYAPNAAMSAIKRHALVDWGNGKDIVEEKEGPLTKSIRLTSALILKNIVVYSPMGKRHLKRYESRLTLIAMSNAESARTVSQILSELAES